MQKSLQKCQSLLHQVADFETNGIFLLKRAKSVQRISYQTYFSGMNFRRRRSQEQNISENVVATSPSRNILSCFLLIFFLLQKRNEKPCLVLNLQYEDVLSNSVLDIKLSLHFISRCSFFLERTVWFWCSHYLSVWPQ
jgi:hypothetical protein